MSEHTKCWTIEIVAGHQCEVFEPPHCNRDGWVLVYLHGVHLGSLQEQGTYTDLFAQFGLPVIAPRTGPTWWTDRICPEFDTEISAEQYVRNDVLAYVRQRWGSAPPQIGLFGSSMGGQGALRMAYKYPQLFPVVAALSPAIDYQIRFHEGDQIIRNMYGDAEAVRQDTATLHIHPLNWPRHQFFCCDPTDLRWIESVERLQMKLQSLGIPHDYDLDTEGGGHGFEYYNRMAKRVVSFLVDSLKAMR